MTSLFKTSCQQPKQAEINPRSFASRQLSKSLVTRVSLGIMALVVGGAAYLSYQIVRNATLENLKQNALLEGKRSAHEIDHWIGLRKSEAAAIANTPITQTMDWKTMQPFFQSEYQRLNTFLPNLGIIDPQGKFYNLLNGDKNPNLKDRLHFQEGMAGKSTILDPIISRITGKPIIVFAAPIWSELTQEQIRNPIGVVNAPIGVDEITQVIQKMNSGSGSYAFALNSKGEVITHPDESLRSTLEKPAPSFLQSADPNLAKIARKMVDRHEGVELITLNSQSQYIVFLPLEEVNWSVALVIPQENIEKQLKLLDGIATIVVLLVGSLIGILVYLQTLEQKQLKQSKALAEKEVAKKTAELQASQLHLVQSEKMSALGGLVAGVAHEINNPITCVTANIPMIASAIQDLFHAIDLYAEQTPKPSTTLTDELEDLDLDFLRSDLPKLLQSMEDGSDRITAISKSLRTFSRTDTDTKSLFELSEGIESTLMILRHRIKANQHRPEIQVITSYSKLPQINCFPGQLNQVFMNILANAIDALDESNQGKSFADIQQNPNQITITTTDLEDQWVKISIADNGPGMPESVRAKIFEQSFTTKAVGKGTGLGLAIARQIIVDKHDGQITVQSDSNQGSTFIITLPVS